MEWCDYLHYFPAAFDGKCSLVPAAMREDVAAIVQLLLVVVQSTRGQLPYTQNEYKKTWEQIFLQIYVHADRLAHKLHDEEGTGHDVKTFI